MARQSNAKTCYCWNCDRSFHPLGIMNHRKKHLNNGEEVTITYTHGNTLIHGRGHCHWVEKGAPDDTNSESD